MTAHEWTQAITALQRIADHLQPDPWNRFLAIGTFLTFAATAYMAWKTSQLARDTLDASILADIHHKESQSGLIIWCGQRLIQFLPNVIVIRGNLINVGPGAATGVSISIFGENPSINWGTLVDSLAVGAQFAASPEEDRLWTFMLREGEVRQKLLSQNPEFRISYKTIYDRERTTTYRIGGRTVDQSGTHFQYTEELIDLNRDERVASLQRRRKAGIFRKRRSRRDSG